MQAHRSSLHDGELLTVSIERAKSVVHLGFRMEDGSMRGVELQGLHAFRIENLTLQNVVSRLLRSSCKEIPTVEFDHWITWVTSLSDASSWLDERHRQEWFDSFISGALDLVVLDPSVGATLAAVCERIVIK